MKLGDIETDKDDRLIDLPPKIISVEVLWNPLDDIIPRQVPKKEHPVSIEDANKENKKKTVKKLNLLSFGDEVEEEEKVLASMKGKIKSSHDVLNDPRLLKGKLESTELDPLELKRNKEVQTSVRVALSLKKDDSLKKECERVPSDVNDYIDEDEADFNARMRQQIFRKMKQLGDSSNQPQTGRKEKGTLLKRVSVSPVWTSGQNSDHQVVRQEKLNIKNKGLGSKSKAALTKNIDIDV